MKVVQELEVLTIVQHKSGDDVFCDVISGAAEMSMEVELSKAEIIKILTDNGVLKEEDGEYTLLNFNYYGPTQAEKWWDDDIFDLLSAYRG